MSTPRYPYVHVHVAPEYVETISDRLWILGASGIEERDATTLEKSARETTLLIASFDHEENAEAAIGELSALPEVGDAVSLEFVVGDEWRDGWREYFKPTLVSPRILVRPSWEEASPPEGACVLVIDPGNAFGSGLHETTRLVLREVDARVQGGEPILDVGCGSGILSIAALLLGAKSAHGTDIDPIALDTTLENAELNGVASQMSVGGADLDDVKGSYPLVLANIQAHVLIPMAPKLISKVRDGGTLILSGVLADQVEDVTPAFGAMRLECVREDGEWRAIVLSKTS
ncbi:MAG: ribosomal protein L11 methyltransferase [Polyangiales bacterium]|jgi:ribosomal protein L11 methyltransferase